MTSDEEVSVWAYTSDYDMIVVEGSDMEPLYGLQNRHTSVIEIQEPVFSNAINYLIEAQMNYDLVSDMIDKDGYVSIDDIVPDIKVNRKEIH